MPEKLTHSKVISDHCLNSREIFIENMVIYNWQVLQWRLTPICVTSEGCLASTSFRTGVKSLWSTVLSWWRKKLTNTYLLFGSDVYYLKLEFDQASFLWVFNRHFINSSKVYNPFISFETLQKRILNVETLNQRSPVLVFKNPN